MGQFAFAEQDVAPGERATERVRLMLAASIQDSEGEWNAATIYDLSETGLLMECSRDLPLGSSLRLEHPQLGTCAMEVVWLSGSFYGCQLDRPLHRAVVAAAYRSSRVIWPPFQADGPEHRAQPVAPESELAAAGKLGVRTRLLIIGGSGAALWGGLLVAIGVV